MQAEAISRLRGDLNLCRAGTKLSLYDNRREAEMAGQISITPR